ncbi:hypothetical protein ACFL1E_03525 [Candidatus Omnitrophota bacterium]
MILAAPYLDETSQLVLKICFFGIIATGLASLVPLSLKQKRNWWSLYLPLCALIFYGIYEWRIPPSITVRFDLLFIYPVFLLIFSSGIVRWVLAYHISSKHVLVAERAKNYNDCQIQITAYAVLLAFSALMLQLPGR